MSNHSEQQRYLSDKLTVAQAAEEAGVDPRTLMRYWRLGVGPARIKLQRRVLVRRCDLESWLDDHLEPQGPRVQASRGVAGSEGLGRMA